MNDRSVNGQGLLEGGASVGEVKGESVGVGGGEGVAMIDVFHVHI
jgi:hypothetical protein